MRAALRDRQLREDVMYRLAVFPLHIPPLREREEDIVLLAQHFLARLNREAGTHKHLSEASLSTLTQYNWPGNVRELKNAVERAFIMADDSLNLMPSIIPRRQDALLADNAPGQGINVPLGSRLDEAERSLIVATLEHFEGNKRRAAEVLGCSLKTLYNKLNTYARETSWAQQS
jgi:DNA-binding NtrC family response regulator